MSITNLIIFLINLIVSYPLLTKQTIKVDNCNISTPKMGVQDLIVTQYDCSPRQITNRQYYKLKNIGGYKNKPADFQNLSAQVSIISQIRTLQVRAYAIYAKLSDNQSVYHKITLKRGFRFDHDNSHVNNMERTFFPTKIEARREIARVGLVNKHHYHSQMKQFDLIRDPRWQANIKDKQGRFQLNGHRPFAFQYGNMAYNPRVNE